MRPDWLAAVSLLTLACCTTPPPLDSGEPTSAPGKVLEVDVREPVEIRLRWNTGETIERVGQLRSAYRFTSGEQPGLVGSRIERVLRERVLCTLLDARAGEPTRIRRDHRISLERVTETTAGDAVTRKDPAPTPLHQARFALRREAPGRSSGLPSAVAATLVFDIASMRRLLPPTPVRVGESWTISPDVLLQIRGATAPGRQVRGTAQATLNRVISVDGTRSADVRLRFTTRYDDRRVVGGTLEYELEHDLQLEGEYWHDLESERPLRLRLAGDSRLAHRPVRVDFVPLGQERLARPFTARGEIEIQLEFR